MIDASSKVLVLAPHTDDGELAAGGSIARWIRGDAEVHYVAFSGCQSSVPEGWHPDVLLDEVKAATKVLGVKPENLTVHDFQVRRFAEVRQEILQTMVDLNNELEPDLVLMPVAEDLHQDHHVIAVEGKRAFKRRSILAYEAPWNNIQFRTECFVTLSEEDVQAKCEAVKAYESQGGRDYVSEEFLRSQLRFRGTQIGVRYAEAFEVVRWIVN